MATTLEHGSTTSLTHKLELRSTYGPVYREVLKSPPRDCNSSEIPIIDLRNMSGTLQDRQTIAKVVRDTAENTGFFYIRNHGISKETVNAALKQAQTFFSQPTEKKALVSQEYSDFHNGWAQRRTTHVSPSESIDHKESFTFRYDPKYDPQQKAGDVVPEDVKKWLQCEEFVWENTGHLPNFKQDVLAYWQSCLTLSRNMIKIFALALDLPEEYFKEIVAHPGSDGVLNYYPKNTAPRGEAIDVGIGAHTDLQCFTLLWQDNVGGLQVLTKDGQWVKVPPIPDTFVVNIGDFLMRLSNDRFKSTVHRVYNYAEEDRYSMPFFFGFNFNEKCSVLPSCTDENNPPRYEPISCGEWVRIRIQKAQV